MPLSPAAERVRQVRTKELIALLRDTAEHIPEPERLNFGAYFDRFGSAQTVLLGESTHGTSEFYRPGPQSLKWTPSLGPLEAAGAALVAGVSSSRTMSFQVNLPA